jgi:hypothetical protein
MVDDRHDSPSDGARRFRPLQCRVVKLSLIACLLGVLATILSACGSSQSRTPQAIALVNSRPIPQSEYRQYVLYADRFYAASGQGHCPGVQPGCTLLQQQVLRRLLEQSLVQQYAQQHHITLSPAEQQQVEARLATLAAPGSPTGTLLTRRQVTRRFIRSLLADELLVQAVEQAVVPTQLERGRSYRLRIVTVPISPGGRQAAYQAALDVATNGGAAPTGAGDRTEWVAAFRLGLAVQHTLQQAQVGEYVGPYEHADSYRVFQLRGQKWGRYGRPARQRIETTYFRHWLDAQLSAAHPVCYAGNRQSSCP